jgi:hypothetical protein
MRHRVRRWLRSDRTFWTLLALTIVGVTAAYYVAREAEKRQTEWVHGLERTGPAPTEPAIPDPRAAPVAVESAAPPPPPSTATRSSAAAAPATRVTVVSLLTTPEIVTAGAMTPECTRVIDDKGPWKNATAAEPWPECVDRAGRPMVVQFCTYALLSTGEWVPSKNTGDAPRCRAELPLVRQGKVRGATAR